MAELADSIRETGLLQPIVVRRERGGGYSVLIGEQRLEACKRLGWHTIPAVVQEERQSDSGPVVGV